MTERRSGSDGKLSVAAIAAFASLAGGAISAVVTGFFNGSSTLQQTNVQLVQLAIGILSQPLKADDPKNVNVQAEKVIRTWAADTINDSARVKFDTEAKEILVNGQASFSTKWLAWTGGRGAAGPLPTDIAPLTMGGDIRSAVRLKDGSEVNIKWGDIPDFLADNPGSELALHDEVQPDPSAPGVGGGWEGLLPQPGAPSDEGAPHN